MNLFERINNKLLENDDFIFKIWVSSVISVLIAMFIINWFIVALIPIELFAFYMLYLNFMQLRKSWKKYGR